MGRFYLADSMHSRRQRLDAEMRLHEARTKVNKK
jgi:hypothetical protein